MRDARLVRGRWVVTGPADPVLTDGAVLVAGGRVVEVGRYPALRHRYPGAVPLGGDGLAVLPGLVNAHHHAAAATALQHGIGDDLLEPWLLALRRRRRAADVRLEVLLASARLLRSGVTAVVDLYGGGGTAAEFEGEARRALAAYEEAGIRVAFAPGITERSHLVSGPAEEVRFLTALPADLRAAAEGLLPGPDAVRADEYLAIVEALCGRYRGHPRIDVWFGPPGPQWTAEATWRRIGEAAARLDTRIQTHVEESLYEKLLGPRTYGTSAVGHLERLGVLTPRLSIAHGVWLTEPEIERLAARGVAVSHNPGSNLRLRAGIGPLNALLSAGVTVAVGLDGHGLDDDDDLFREMRLALRLNRTPRLDGPAPSRTDVLAMATTGGARLLGKAGELGRLAPGFAADLVLVDLERILAPWTAPEADPRELLLLRAQARDVRAVLVEGEVVLADGRPTRFDEVEAARELRARLATAPYPAEAADAAERLRPHLVAHYLGWNTPDLVPYTAYNSRR